MALTPTWNLENSDIWFSQLLCDTTGEKVLGLCSGGNEVVAGDLYLSSNYGKTWAWLARPQNQYYHITYIAADSTLTYIFIAGHYHETVATRLFRYIDIDGYKAFHFCGDFMATWSVITCDATGKYFVAGQSGDYHDIVYGYFTNLTDSSPASVVSILADYQSLNPNWDFIKMSSDGTQFLAIANNNVGFGKFPIFYSLTSGTNTTPTLVNYEGEFWTEHDAVCLTYYFNGNHVYTIIDDNSGSQQVYRFYINNSGPNNYGSWALPAPGDQYYNSISCDSTGQYLLLSDKYNDRVYLSSIAWPSPEDWVLQTTPTDGLSGVLQSCVLMSPNHMAGYFSVGTRGLNAFLQQVACFTAGSLILTPNGYKNVEDFKDDDEVLTSDGKIVPVNVYTTTLVTTVETAPYRILANTFEEGVPKNDLCLSPYHAIKIGKDMWQVPIRAAEIYKSKISQYDVAKEITYYHLETPNYMSDHLICDGTVVESYAGDQMLNKNKNIYAYQPLLLAYNRMNVSQPIMI